MSREEMYSNATADTVAANFFVLASKELSKSDKVIPGSITNLYTNQNVEAFGLLSFAMHDWEIGAIKDAGPILRSFARARVKEPDAWIMEYKPMAAIYFEDFKKLDAIEIELAKVKDAAAAQALLAKVNQTRGELQSGSRATDRLDALEQEVIAKGAKP